MRNTILVAALGALAFTSTSVAAEKDGVRMPDTLQVEGERLQLNGIGTRTKFVFNVYVAGLYLETPTKSAEQVLQSDQTKRVVMVMLRDLDQKSIADAVREGFQKNAGPNMPKLQERLNTFLGQLPPGFKKGDKFVVTYVPGKGTLLAGEGERLAIEGKDFADAMFAVWLGKSPVDDGLKRAMLGQE